MQRQRPVAGSALRVGVPLVPFPVSLQMVTAVAVRPPRRSALAGKPSGIAWRALVFKMTGVFWLSVSCCNRVKLQCPLKWKLLSQEGFKNKHLLWLPKIRLGQECRVSAAGGCCPPQPLSGKQREVLSISTKNLSLDL